MEDIKQGMYTAGQVSRLCRISKDALSLYERKGLFSPSYTAENGYRYYTKDDFYRLEMILDLKAAGCSLKKIKEHLDTLSTEGYLQLLSENIARIEQEEHRLKLLKEQLRESLIQTELGLREPLQNIHIEYQAEERLLISSYNEIYSDSASISAFSALVNDCFALGFSPSYHLGAMIPRNLLEEGCFSPDHVFTRIPPSIQCGACFIKPAGYYVTAVNKGPYEKLPEFYPLLMTYIKENGLRLAGSAYEDTLIGWFNSSGHKEDYVTRVSIHVQ